MAKKKQQGLVIVESPAKAKKINSFLGSNYKVLASMGHVRDLPARAAEIPPEVKKLSWATLGVDVANGFEPLYVVPREKKKVIAELKAALKDAAELILATDEDREGESIGWHLTEVLKPKVPVRRMVFSEITRQAISKAIQQPRELDQNLVNAQETRRVLDRLYGYRLSPLLWKKVAPKLSAGRVQSVAVRLIVARELERRAFHPATWWDLKATLCPAGEKAQTPFTAELHAVEGKRIATGRDFDDQTGQLKERSEVLLLGEAQVRQLEERLRGARFQVAAIDEREQTRRPYPPFTTSTLQQEANRKLNLSARETMQVAQRLYEDGHITYMRTDSVALSNEALQAARRTIVDRYGEDYLHPEVRTYETRAKGAQEAHEAIRPAGTQMQTGEELGLSGRELALYSLIWKRTVATQMKEARLRFQTVTITAGEAEFRATGRHVEFPGFFRAYVEGVDDPEAALDDQESALPPLAVGEPLLCQELGTVSHQTQPPARYTEATLVRALEADGIGRPSTYASIIGTIQDRGYVVKQGNQLRPTFTALAVTRLLEMHFPHLVDEQFTARMEQTLDDIAAGQAQRLPYLQEFYQGQQGLDHQVSAHEEQIDPRSACTIELEGLSARVRVGKFGPYLEATEDGQTLTASIPPEIAPADLTDEIANRLLHERRQGPRSLGNHPQTGQPIYVMNGRFGPYLQLGTAEGEDNKPKRVSIPRGIEPSQVTLEQALELLALPRTLGMHPQQQKPVTAGIGRYGPYVFVEGIGYRSLPKGVDVTRVDLESALKLLAEKRVRGAAQPLKELGPHPADQQPVQLFEGRYGPYVKHGKINATIPKDTPLESVDLGLALNLLDQKAQRDGQAPRSRRAPGKSRRDKTARGPA